MQVEFGRVDAQEYARLHEQYAPLTAAVRDLVDASLRTGVDAETMGATTGLTKPKFTGTITVRYLRGTPLGPLQAEAWIDHSAKHKTYARGVISDAQGPTVEAEGVFIMPAWAREA